MKEQQIRTILNHAQIYASRNLWRNLRISVKTRTLILLKWRLRTQEVISTSLKMLPKFTIKEIEQYRQFSGKTPQ